MLSRRIAGLFSSMHSSVMSYRKLSCPQYVFLCMITVAVICMNFAVGLVFGLLLDTEIKEAGIAMIFARWL